jgi:hypothetical protein
MNKNEFFIWFGQQVKTRWPTWQVSDLTLADWFTAFGRFDQGLLTQAVQHHKIYDDSLCPKTKKLFEIIRKLRPPAAKRSAERQKVPPDKNEKLYTFNEYWQMIRTTWSKEKRIENMLGWLKVYPKAKEKDPEAYDWIVKDKLHEKLNITYKPRLPARYRNARPAPPRGEPSENAIGSKIENLGVLKND